MKKLTINTQDPIVQRVAKRLDERSVVGLDKYKKSLKEDNRTTIEWLTMLQEELLDAANYVEKLKDVTIDESSCRAGGCVCDCEEEDIAEANYMQDVEARADELGITLPCDYMDFSFLNLPDATYDLYHTTWVYIDDNPEPVTTKKIGTVTVRGTETNLLEAFAGLEPMCGRNYCDPHNFFEGFSVHKNKVFINFGS